MPESLSRSLVDAAGNAIAGTECGHLAELGIGECIRCEAVNAVAAVLETLAAHHHDNGGIFGAAHIEALRRLAVEARED